MKNMSKKAGNILFLLLVFGLTVWAVFREQDLGAIRQGLGQANPLWLIPAVGCVIAFILGESLAIFFLTHHMNYGVRLRRCCLYSFIGFFYCAITPSASGGQPMQVVAMRADGIPVAVSTVVLAVVTILYKLVLVLLGAAVCLLKPRSLMVYLEPALPLIRLGMALNVVFIGALLLVVFHPGLARAMVGGLLSFLSRFRLFRNTEHSGKRLERILEQYQGTAVFFRQQRHLIFRVFLITVFQRMSLFLVTWFTYKSFGLHGHSLGQIVFLQAMISVAADMLPLPGGMGISEAMFLDIFGGIFGSALLLPAMVISRGISYYTQLVLCGLVTAAAAIAQGLKNRKVN
mgnify:FL=1